MARFLCGHSAEALMTGPAALKFFPSEKTYHISCAKGTLYLVPAPNALVTDHHMHTTVYSASVLCHDSDSVVLQL
eukprot:1859311-Ditylum_brightwellii.AAC.1